MKPHLNPRFIAKRQRGQAMVEYALASAALAVVLWVDVAGDEGVLRMALRMLAALFKRYSMALSLPI